MALALGWQMDAQADDAVDDADVGVTDADSLDVADDAVTDGLSLDADLTMWTRDDDATAHDSGGTRDDDLSVQHEPDDTFGGQHDATVNDDHLATVHHPLLMRDGVADNLDVQQRDAALDDDGDGDYGGSGTARTLHGYIHAAVT